MTIALDNTKSATRRALRIGVGGPVGSGKTMLVRRIIESLQSSVQIGVVTNDIYTKEDADFLTNLGILPQNHILGVETGGCPHSAIRDDVSMNLAAIDELTQRCDQLDLILVESGGDNLTAMFSPDLADKTIYVIDVAQGDKIPRKGGPGLTFSDLLIINKISLAPFVGANLETMEHDAQTLRGERATIFSDLGDGRGIDQITRWISDQIG
ncbi:MULTISPECIES: urease accessory protein UreG [Acidithrix]|uniref:Urease accessory protein UreG n=1 Tax=Acidithrix ferrooxidans TaxID=1280514 RepID=A0A0D8HG16_9ACTN|nr:MULTISPECIES: urease accessory protein UreG [Acidithrix]KJF16848.1 urease accessory protein UreG [Acidithrix ferrooxidans]CAG4932168.1 unnamed protein product [Acidithrix sp. C25]